MKEEKKNAYRFLMEVSEEKTLLGRPGHTQQCDTKMSNKEI